ncbi:hypothetical protein [Microbacterium sp. Leaf203]|uniref:hypothetical protein n=1 Tax=Microbacterium sp. Leaf203 TaxID=1735677 RepID=UPI000B045AC9|nr:hypothetical protein [Microbacterium sp. Leaf203]
MFNRTLLLTAGLLLSAAALCAVATDVQTPASQPSPTASTATMTPPSVVTTEVPDVETSESPDAPPTHVIADIQELTVGDDLVIDPPDFEHVFRVHGLPDGPIWLAAHARSLGRGTAPGNVFLTFQVGDRIEALGTSWRVTERWSALKGDAGAQGPYSDPQAYSGRLILVSCLPREGGAATSNTWLVAEPIGEE